MEVGKSSAGWSARRSEDRRPASRWVKS